MVFACDLDDTLFRELDFVDSGYRAIGVRLNEAAVIDADGAVNCLRSAETMTAGFDSLAAMISRVNPTSPFTARWMVETYRYHIPEITLREGAVDLLNRLQQCGAVIAIITDGRSLTQRNKICALGLDRWVNSENVIVSEEIGSDKRTPEPFLRLASRYPQEQHFVYIGDNPVKDFRWPNELGWITIQIINPPGYAVHPQNVEVAARYRASHRIAALPEALNVALATEFEGK